MARHVELKGSTRPLLPSSRAAGPIDPNALASVTVRVRRKHGPAKFNALVARMNLQAPSERKYLDRAELAEKFGAAAADLDLVERVAHKHNLTVARRSSAERALVLRGRLKDLLAAFPADLHLFHSSRGTYRARRGPIFVPSELEGVVTGVFGFDTRPKHRSRPFRAGLGSEDGVAATTYADRYQFPFATAGQTLDGSGQTIAIIELGGGYQSSDLAAYFKEIDQPLPNVIWQSVDHMTNAPTDADSADGEVMLDIEVAGAVAPGARQVVYFAPNQGNQGFMDALSAAVHDTERTPQIVSISWGGPEDGLTDADLGEFSSIFAEACALGITVCIASGDHGVADMAANDWDRAIHVDHPACDPHVLGCGGTQIDDGVDVVWNDGTPFDADTPGGGGWTSGGGVSTRFPVPVYQAQAKIPNSLASAKTGRGVPDIAMSAVNYFVRVDSSEGASGGTSAVAPLMSALVARLNQAKGRPCGFLNTLFYAEAGQLFTDVVSGDNGVANTIQGYKAGVGWDACTGLGTPIGTEILNAL